MTTRAARPAYLVALDVDGTTIDHAGHLSSEVHAAVRAVADAGHHVVIATGRSVVSAMPIIAKLGLTHGYAVCSNGAVTLRLEPAAPNGYEIDDLITFDPKPALATLLTAWPTAIVAVEVLGVGFHLSAPFPEGELQGELTVVDRRTLAANPVTRMTFRAPDTTAEHLMELIRGIGLHGVSYSVGWSAWLDITPEGVSKGAALELVRRTLHVEPMHTVAVGDQRNDLEMLQWAARGVAMGHAPDEVKAVADEVTGQVDDDGLVPVLRSLL